MFATGDTSEGRDPAGDGPEGPGGPDVSGGPDIPGVEAPGCKQVLYFSQVLPETSNMRTRGIRGFWDRQNLDQRRGLWTWTWTWIWSC